MIEKHDFKALTLEYSLTEYNSAFVISKHQYQIDDVILFMGKWYVVTKQITKSGTMNVFEIKSNGKLSDSKGIQLTDTTVSKFTRRKG